jgi:tetratricopeptide (TPR) repeat protein
VSDAAPMPSVGGKTVRRRFVDKRLIGLLTTGLIAVVGLVFHWLPDSVGEGLGSLSGGRGEPSEPPAAHAAQEIRREVDLRFKEGVILLHARNYEQAAKALHRVLELSPAMPEAHVNMGYALLGLHRDDEARDFFRGAIGLRPSQANAYYGLAEALADLGDLAGAIAAMRNYLSLTPTSDRFFAKGEAALVAWQAKEKSSGAKGKGIPPGGSPKT